MPEQAPWRFQKIIRPMVDIPTEHIVLVGRVLTCVGDEIIDVLGVEQLKARMELELVIHRANGTVDKTNVLCRVDTADEVEYYRNGGILQYVLRGMAKAA